MYTKGKCTRKQNKKQNNKKQTNYNIFYDKKISPIIFSQTNLYIKIIPKKNMKLIKL